MTFDPSPARRGLDLLLAAHPHLDLVGVDWQRDDTFHAAGPWLLVALGQPSEGDELVTAWAVHYFAIWKRTGAVHAMGAGPGGPVSDDPIFQP